MTIAASAASAATAASAPLWTLDGLRAADPVLGIALPSFVTGPLFALVFGLYLRWLPVAGWETGQLRYLVLPVITLALPEIAYIARLTRGQNVTDTGAQIQMPVGPATLGRILNVVGEPVALDHRAGRSGRAALQLSR